MVVIGVACTEPLALASIQLGRSLNIDNSVGAPTSTFSPNETVYVSIRTTARGKGTLGVRWKYRDRVIDEPSKEVTTDGTKAIEFHLVNAGGFPIGDYSVDVIIDGQVAGTRNFKVDQK
jgi:archaellum component FlaG (FlaF/FlaG flagellin family)